MEFHLKVINSLTDLLDNKFNLLGFKFGLDPLIGLIPGIGDVISLALSAYIVWVAKQLDLPDEKINQMFQNIIKDFMVGLIPVVGDISDFFYKANSKNLKIINEHLKTKPIIEGKLVSA